MVDIAKEELYSLLSLPKLLSEWIAVAQKDSQEMRGLIATLTTEIKVISNTLGNDRNNREGCYKNFADHEERLRKIEKAQVGKTEYDLLVAKVDTLQSKMLIATGVMTGVITMFTVVPKIIEWISKLTAVQ